jgi:hypothetical protein
MYFHTSREVICVSMKLPLCLGIGPLKENKYSYRASGQAKSLSENFEIGPIFKEIY